MGINAGGARTLTTIQRDRFILYHPIETVLNRLDRVVNRAVNIRAPCSYVGDEPTSARPAPHRMQQHAQPVRPFSRPTLAPTGSERWAISYFR